MKAMELFMWVYFGIACVFAIGVSALITNSIDGSRKEPRWAVLSVKYGGISLLAMLAVLAILRIIEEAA